MGYETASKICWVAMDELRGFRGYETATQHIFQPNIRGESA